MNENEFELDGKVYVAEQCVLIDENPSCCWCAFDALSKRINCKIVPCDDHERKDGRNVIFVEKQQ